MMMITLMEALTVARSQELWRSRVEVLAAVRRATHLPGARGKAVQLLRQCLLVYSVATFSHKSLQDFMKRFNLKLVRQSPSTATSPDKALAVHVELSYKYGLSGLLRIRPSVVRSLSVQLDREALIVSAERVEKATVSYLFLLASIAEIKYDVRLLLQWNTLQQSMNQAVARAWIVSAQSARTASQAFKKNLLRSKWL
ncbi:hypothetical protein MRX96_023919 [Rhipicephalus microplus]